MNNTVEVQRAALNIIAQILVAYAQILAVNPARAPQIAKDLEKLSIELRKLGEG